MVVRVFPRTRVSRIPYRGTVARSAGVQLDKVSEIYTEKPTSPSKSILVTTIDNFLTLGEFFSNFGPKAPLRGKFYFKQGMREQFSLLRGQFTALLTA